MSEHHGEIHELQREEDKGKGVLMIANKYDIPHQLQDATRSPAALTTVDPPTHSESYDLTDSSMSCPSNIEHHKIKINTQERRWDGMLPLEGNNQVDVWITKDQED